MIHQGRMKGVPRCLFRSKESAVGAVRVCRNESWRASRTFPLALPLDLHVLGRVCTLVPSVCTLNPWKSGSKSYAAS